QIGAGEFDPARKQRLIRHTSQRVRDLAGKVLGAAVDIARQKVIDDYQPALSLAGDAKHGAKLFGQHCATCHRLGDVGQEVGPNLKSVANWKPDVLMTEIHEPSRQAQHRYLRYTVLLNDGQTNIDVITDER